jgi:RNA polymerase sigma factor (sigma-70 family)
MRDHDEEDAPLTDAQRALAESGLPVAWSVSRWFARRHPRLAGDLLGAAMLALCTTARDYGPDCGSSFANYAGHRVKGACADLVRTQGRFWASRKGRAEPPRVMSMSRPVAHRRPQPIGDVFMVAHTPRPEYEAEWADEFEWALAGLNDRSRTFFRLVYGPADLNQAEAGRLLGLNQAKATRLHAAAAAVVRARLERHMDDLVGLRRKGA